MAPSEQPLITSCPADTWKTQRDPDGIFRLEFRRPSETEVLVSQCIQFALTAAYLAFCGHTAFSASSVNANSFFFFCFLSSPLLLFSYIKTTAHGDQRFIPYLVEVHESQKSLFLKDTRYGREETVIIPIAQIQDIFVRQSFSKYSPPPCIAIRCQDGHVFLLPPVVLPSRPMAVLTDAIKHMRA